MKSLLLQQITKMDVRSEEWNAIYHAVNEKHWNTTPDVNDDYFKAARLLNMLSNRDVPELILAIATVAEQVFAVIEKGSEAVQAELHIGKHKLFFRLATSTDAVDRLQKVLSNTVLVQTRNGAEPSGGVTQ